MTLGRYVLVGPRRESCGDLTGYLRRDSEPAGDLTGCFCTGSDPAHSWVGTAEFFWGGESRTSVSLVLRAAAEKAFVLEVIFWVHLAK